MTHENPMPDELPVGPETFSSLIWPWAGRARYAIAVSGGGDSMALLRLCMAWAQRATEGGGADVQLTALTVDHGLRAGSGEEARQVGAWCDALGVSHTILEWRDPRPETGIQEAARQARYRLMAAWCAEHDAPVLLTGHTQDDVAETFLARLARGSGPAGLSCMKAEVPIAAGAGATVALARPLLSISRRRLRANLAQFGQNYIDDPSNDDTGYERVRWRQRLAAPEQFGLGASALATSARRIGVAHSAMEREIGDRLSEAQVDGYGEIRIERRAVGVDPAGLVTFGRLIQAAAGRAYAPGEQALSDALSALLCSGAQQQRGGRTLAGVLLATEGEDLVLAREPAAVEGREDAAPAALPLKAGGTRLWDGRFKVSLPQGAGDGEFFVAPFGETGRRAAKAAGIEVGPYRAAQLSSPALWSGQNVLSHPVLGVIAPGAPMLTSDFLGLEDAKRGVIRY